MRRTHGHADPGLSRRIGNANQLGGSLGLGVLVVVFAAAATGAVDPRAELAHRVATSLTAGADLLVLALAVVIIFILRRPTARTFVLPGRDAPLKTSQQ